MALFLADLAQPSYFMEEATQALDRGKDVDVICLDFAKAFDKVPHKRLLRKLSGYGIKAKSIIG